MLLVIKIIVHPYMRDKLWCHIWRIFVGTAEFHDRQPSESSRFESGNYTKLWRSTEQHHNSKHTFYLSQWICDDKLHTHTHNCNFLMLRCSHRYKLSGRRLLSPHATFRVSNLFIFQCDVHTRVYQLCASTRIPNVRHYTGRYHHAKQIMN